MERKREKTQATPQEEKMMNTILSLKGEIAALKSYIEIIKEEDRQILNNMRLKDREVDRINLQMEGYEKRVIELVHERDELLDRVKLQENIQAEENNAVKINKLKEIDEALSIKEKSSKALEDQIDMLERSKKMVVNWRELKERELKENLDSKKKKLKSLHSEMDNLAQDIDFLEIEYLDIRSKKMVVNWRELKENLDSKKKKLKSLHSEMDNLAQDIDFLEIEYLDIKSEIVDTDEFIHDTLEIVDSIGGKIQDPRIIIDDEGKSRVVLAFHLRSLNHIDIKSLVNFASAKDAQLAINYYCHNLKLLCTIESKSFKESIK